MPADPCMHAFEQFQKSLFAVHACFYYLGRVGGGQGQQQVAFFAYHESLTRHLNGREPKDFQSVEPTLEFA